MSSQCIFRFLHSTTNTVSWTCEHSNPFARLLFLKSVTALAFLFLSSFIYQVQFIWSFGSIQSIWSSPVCFLWNPRRDQMLMNALRALINNLIKKSFYGKRKKTINVLTVFFIFYKSNVKTFLKWIVNQCLKSTH